MYRIAIVNSGGQNCPKVLDWIEVILVSPGLTSGFICGVMIRWVDLAPLIVLGGLSRLALAALALHSGESRTGPR